MTLGWKFTTVEEAGRYLLKVESTPELAPLISDHVQEIVKQVNETNERLIFQNLPRKTLELMAERAVLELERRAQFKIPY